MKDASGSMHTQKGFKEKNNHSLKSVKKSIISNSSFISSVSNDRLSADHAG
jgi:hypothetical protein